MSPRYKLRLPSEGDVLHSDCGDLFAVADSDAVARGALHDYTGDPVVFIHPCVARHSVLYARDIEAGDCHEDAEPGDTTWTIVGGDPRCEGDVRVWALGAPRVSWKYDYLPPDSVDWRDIPVGTPCYYKPEGHGKVCAPPRTWRNSGKPRFPILFDNGSRRDLFLGQFALHYGGPFPMPPRLVRVRMADEVVVERCTERMARIMCDLRATRLRAEWEAEQFDALTRSAVLS